MSNKLTLTDILEVIDNHIESETQFMFVCDKDLAEMISEYVADNYDLYDENMELSDKYKDYYVSLYFDYEEVRFFCETARSNSGEYKFSDAMEERVDYFIVNDMSEHDADRYLQGENCTWSWIDLDNNKSEDECDTCEDTDCKNCVEEESEDKCDCPECIKDEEGELIQDLLILLFDEDSCVNCRIEKVIDTLYEFKDLGRREMKQKTMEFLDMV